MKNIKPTLRGGAPLAALFSPLAAHYLANARELPWRADPTPYHVWLSEIMLQQTRIEAVRPYYARFLESVPDISALAALPDDKLMKLWEGLGYYSRARNLKKAACRMVELHGGEMPATYEEIRALPGVGDYTAGAIASIVYGLPYPAVDGNVLRVLARLTADEADVLLPETKKRMTAALQEVYLAAEKTDFTTHAPTQNAKIGVTSPAAILTQGLMELGQTHCLPNAAPHCDACPLASLCRAYEEGRTEELPHRSKAKPRRMEHRLILLLADGEGRFALRRRPPEGLLAGLWELPSVLLQKEPSGSEILDTVSEFCDKNRLICGETVTLPPARHLFTHIAWHMVGCYVNVRSVGESELVFATREELLDRYALPSAFRAFLPYITGER